MRDKIFAVFSILPCLVFAQNFEQTIQTRETLKTIQKNLDTYYQHTFDKEGNEDLIPDNIELPEDDGELDEEGEDLDVSDLEGIVLPTADGGLMVIENGVLVPYSEEAAATPAAPEAGVAPEELKESETNVEGSSDEGQNELNENTDAGENPDTQTIEESADLSKHSSVVQSLISQMNFSKGGF